MWVPAHVPPAGRRIGRATGRGFRRGDGRGSTTRRGASRHSTTVAGYGSIGIGPGRPARSSGGRSMRRRWSLSSAAPAGRSPCRAVLRWAGSRSAGANRTFRGTGRAHGTSQRVNVTNVTNVHEHHLRESQPPRSRDGRVATGVRFVQTGMAGASQHRPRGARARPGDPRPRARGTRAWEFYLRTAGPPPAGRAAFA